MSLTFRILWSALTVGAISPAQVFLVGGVGAHFADLPAAVAAAPDGATLRVRAGQYTAFTLSGKGLNFVGEGVVTLNRSSTSRNLAIGGTTPRQVIVLRNIQLDDVPYVLLVGAAGPVCFEGCSAVGLRGPDVFVQSCANVQFLYCNLTSTSSSDPPLFLGARIHAIDSSLMLAGCQIRGTNWGGFLFCRPSSTVCTDGECGAHALALLRSRAVVLRTDVRGGDGRPAHCNFLGPHGAGDGGAGCAAWDSMLIALESGLAGGVGGAGAYLYCREGIPPRTCPPGLKGAAFAGSLTQLVSHPHSALAQIVGSQTIGSTVSFALQGPPTPPLLAVMAFGYQGDLMAFAPVGWGSVLALPAAFVGPFALSGRDLQLPWRLPAGLQMGTTYFGQFIVAGTSGVFASNPFPLLATH